LVFKNSTWDFRTLNFDRDVALSDRLNAVTVNATDPDLSAFIAHGGKLLLTHGWSDGLIAPQNTVNYYNSVLEKLGAPTVENSVRLFIIPGEEHCSGDDGASQFDSAAVINRWVETGKAPDRILATHQNGSKVDKTRPLCPYPQIAKFTGRGSPNDAANFVCTVAIPSGNVVRR
jgi:feruloyl esterase